MNIAYISDLSSSQHFTNAPVAEEKAHGRISMATYYRYFKAGGNYLLLAIVLIVFLMGEVYVWVWGIEEGGRGCVRSILCCYPAGKRSCGRLVALRLVSVFAPPSQPLYTV